MIVVAYSETNDRTHDINISDSYQDILGEKVLIVIYLYSGYHIQVQTNCALLVY